MFDSELLILLACLVLVPVCIVFAYRGWMREFRGKSSSSRGMIGLISVLAVFCSWVTLAIFLFLLFAQSVDGVLPNLLGLWSDCFVPCWGVFSICFERFFEGPDSCRWFLPGLSVMDCL